MYRAYRAFAALAILAATAAPVFATCKEEVAQAFEKQRGAKSFRMVTNMVSEQGPIEMTIDYILPNRMHQTVKPLLNPNVVETILVVDRGWTKPGEGKAWEQAPAEFVDELTKQMDETVLRPPSEFVDYACLGKVSVDGAEYFAYRAQDDKTKVAPGAPQADPPVRMFYVDPGTGLPARNIVSTESRIDKPFFKTVYTYPADIAIEPPPAAPAPSP